MQKHELKVKHIASGNELIVSKSYYHNAPDEYEVLAGESGKVADKDEFVLATPKIDDKPAKTKQDIKPVTKNKAAPVPPPTV